MDEYLAPVPSKTDRAQALTTFDLFIELPPPQRFGGLASSSGKLQTPGGGLELRQLGDDVYGTDWQAPQGQWGSLAGSRQPAMETAATSAFEGAGRAQWPDATGQYDSTGRCGGQFRAREDWHSKCCTSLMPGRAAQL